MKSDEPELGGFYYTAKHLSHIKNFKCGPHTSGLPFIQGGVEYECHVEIGDYCAISNNIFLVFPHNHQQQWNTIYQFAQLKNRYPAVSHLDATAIPERKLRIRIGNDVWIGQDVTILGGADISDGAIIGRHAIVAGYIPPYAIAVGNPARVIRYRFYHDHIAKLLELKWWDWPEEKVIKNLEWLCSESKDFSQIIE